MLYSSPPWASAYWFFIDLTWLSLCIRWLGFETFDEVCMYLVIFTVGDATFVYLLQFTRRWLRRVSTDTMSLRRRFETLSGFIWGRQTKIIGVVALEHASEEPLGPNGCGCWHLHLLPGFFLPVVVLFLLTEYLADPVELLSVHLLRFRWLSLPLLLNQGNQLEVGRHKSVFHQLNLFGRKRVF